MAVEVRYILFDVFGEHLKTLCSVEVADIEPTDAHELADRWSASHSDVSHFLSSVAFVAELRTSDGKIWRYNQKAINDELTRVQLKASDTDLNRKKEKE